MNRFSSAVVAFMRSEDGPTAVEYAVMLAMIFVVCIISVTTLGSRTSTKFTAVSDYIS